MGAIAETGSLWPTPIRIKWGLPRQATQEKGNSSTNIVAPRDPNDKIGPSGFGSVAFVSAASPLPYTIDFENVATATAPAQVVTVTDQLDSNLDWRTLQLSEITFGSHTISVPAGRSFYSTTVDLRPEGKNLLVQIDAGIDPTTGIVHWTFVSIDPDTGEAPTDPTLGFLPPNDASGSGQGHVTYTVRPKSDRTTGATVSNFATIIFDTEEPIETNLVSNTLDAVAPTSTVAALPATETTSEFVVSWSGVDDSAGSGLASYDIYVSTDSGTYKLWLAATQQPAGMFTGQSGHTYAFYSVARDNAGNVEAAPAGSDAWTMLLIGGMPAAHAGGPYTVPEGGAVMLDGSASSDPDQSANTLTYAWDLDGDGLFGETGAAALRGDEIGQKPTFVAAGLQGPTSVMVTLRVTDNDGNSDTDTATIIVSPTSPNLDTDGNGTADALSDGILILRYLFDPAGPWNLSDALGSGATRTTMTAIKNFLDGVVTTVLDADGNGQADALTDGILILRYLFDPTGAWNVNDALGAGATRTSREAIKAYLDQYNPSLSPSPPMMAAATAPAEDPLPQSQAVPTDSSSSAVETSERVSSSVEAVNGSDADQVRATISQALVIGGTGTYAFTRVDRTAMPDEDRQPVGLRAVDMALESWAPPTACDVAVWWMPNQRASASNDDAADLFWGEDGLDWFLTRLGDNANALEAGEIAATS